MGTGTGLARQEHPVWVFGRVWNRTKPFFRSKPGPVANTGLYQHSMSLIPSPLSLDLRTPPTSLPLPHWVVVVVRNGFSRHVTCMDWYRLTTSSLWQTFCGPVQCGHAVGRDWTKPYLELGSSGLVESLEVRRPGAREEVYKRSGAAVVKAWQRIQLQKTCWPSSLHIPREALYDFQLYTQWDGFPPGMEECRWSGSPADYTSFTVFVLLLCFWWLFYHGIIVCIGVNKAHMKGRASPLGSSGQY